MSLLSSTGKRVPAFGGGVLHIELVFKVRVGVFRWLAVASDCNGTWIENNTKGKHMGVTEIQQDAYATSYVSKRTRTCHVYHVYKK